MAEATADRLEQDDTVAIVRRNGNVRIGVISKVFEETESDSSDSEMDDDHDEGKLKEGQVQVDWYPAGKSSKHGEDKLILLDRSLLLGEAVCRRLEPQRVGFVTNMHVRGDIAVLPKRQLVFSNVDFDRIKFVTEYGAGAEESTKILYDSWVGNVEECVDRLLLTSTKGYKCWIQDSDPNQLWPEAYVDQGSVYDSTQWYAKQPVIVSYSTLRSVKWLPGYAPPAAVRRRFELRRNSEATMRFVVEKVELDTVTVRWQVCLKASGDLTPPKRVLSGDDLKKIVKLDHFEYQSAQVGDRVHLTRRENDAIVRRCEWQTKLAKSFRNGAPTQSDSSGPSVRMAPPAPSSPLAASSSSLSVGRHPAVGDDCRSTVDSESSVETATTGSDCFTTASEGNSDAGQPSSSPDKTRMERGTSESVASTSRHQSLASRVRRTLALRGGRRAAYAQSRRLIRPRASLKRKASVEGGRPATVREPDGAPKMGETYVGEIVMQHSRLDVLWLDGTTEADICSTELIFSDFDLDQHEFVPGSIVSVKDDPSASGKEMGVVTKIDVQERLATVNWYLLAANGKDEPAFDRTEQSSLFDLENHAHYRLVTPGLLVMRVGGARVDDPNILAKIGQVRAVAPELGKEFVKWFDGTEEAVWPTELSSVFLDTGDDESEVSGVLDPDLDVDMIPIDEGSGDDDDDNSSWQSVSEEDNDNDRFSLFPVDVTPSLASFFGNNPELSAAEEDFRRKCAEALQRIRNIATSSVPSPAPVATQASGPPSQSTTQSAASRQPNQIGEQRPAPMDVVSSNEIVAPASPVAAGVCAPAESTADGERVAQFEMLESCPTDQHYLNDAFDASKCSRHFMRAVQEELKLLQSSLPCGIFMKTFENRMDLFSCLMTGPADTPYANGLFCFDIRLPQEYPVEPPMVYYRSYSNEQLNPNLYLDGKVCVSLLGTWSGKGSERWNPGSSLLQVFVSIQGLILNGEPYFNEAGYESRRALPESVEKSRRYNEMALIRSVENLTTMAKNPPAMFVKEIRRHVRDRATSLIDQVEQWLDGSLPCAFPLQPVSEGCKVSVRRQLAKLKQVSQENANK